MPYSTIDLTFRIFGEVNVAGWADLDNDENEDVINDRYAWAIERAQEEIDSLLLGNCPYSIPFADYPSTPLTIQNLSAVWAGTELYQGRGQTDYDSNGKAINSLQVHIDRFHKAINEIRRGARKLKNVSQIVKAIPAVVNERETHTRHFGPDRNGCDAPLIVDRNHNIHHHLPHDPWDIRLNQ